MNNKKKELDNNLSSPHLVSNFWSIKFRSHINS